MRLNGHWYNPSYSQNSGGNCVECRAEHERVLVRDTQHRELGHLDFNVAAWPEFLTAVRHGEV